MIHKVKAPLAIASVIAAMALVASCSSGGNAASSGASGSGQSASQQSAGGSSGESGSSGSASSASSSDSAASSSSSAASSGGGGLTIDGQQIASADLYAKAKSEGSFTFYTGASTDSETALTGQFTKDTGIKVEIVRLAPNELTQRILSEQGAGKLGADAIRTSGEDLITEIAKSGAFTPYDVPTSLNVPKDIAMDGNKYYQSFNRVYSIAYNNQVVKKADAPTSWKDLADAKWKGHLGIVQVGAGGSTAALTRFMIEKLGTDYLKKYAAQEPQIFQSSGNALSSVERGEIQVTPMPVATAYSAILKDAPLTIVVPKEGVAAYSYYLGVTSSAKHPAAAKVFINWTLSKEGQAQSAKLGDYPVLPDAPAPTIGSQKMPAVGSGFVVRPSTQDILAHVKSDAKQWDTIFGYKG